MFIVTTIKNAKWLFLIFYSDTSASSNEQNTESSSSTEGNYITLFKYTGQTRKVLKNPCIILCFKFNSRPFDDFLPEPDPTHSHLSPERYTVNLYLSTFGSVLKNNLASS